MSDIRFEKCTDYEMLLKFIQDYHSTPSFLLPKEVDDMYISRTTWFKVFDGVNFIAIFSYTKLSDYLVIVRRTIVKPEFRNQGYSFKIWNKAEQMFIELGFKKIISEVLSENMKMLNIKLNQGFVLEGLRRDHDAPGIHRYELSKWI